MKQPEIRIFYSWLLAGDISKQIQELHPDWKFDDDETLELYAENYRKEWAKYNDKILTALVNALGVSFYKSVIDVACAPNIVPVSDPLIISFRTFPDQFVDVLTHELCHVLLTDNTTYSIHSSHKDLDLRDRWAALFGTEHESNTLVHIPVHALCKYIYLDVLRDPSRLERDMKDVQQYAPYRAAWKYVNNHDYKDIIRDLKMDYEAIKSND